MSELPQLELRNNISAVLRAAEAGQTYTITVDGRPVAQLSPWRPRQWVAADDVRALLTTPTDPGLLSDVVREDPPTSLDDPWEQP